MRKVPKPDVSILSPEKQTLFCDPGEKMLLEDNCILFPGRPYINAVFPLASIRTVVCFGYVESPPDVRLALLRAQIPVVWFDGDGEFLGRTEPSWKQGADLLRLAINLADTERLHIAQRIVWGTLRQKRRFLKRCDREHSLGMVEAIQKIEWAIEAAGKKEITAEAIGCLGAGLSAYYSYGFPRVIRPSGWQWEGRDSRSPLNAMLNFVFTLVEQSMITAIACNGLNPHLGLWQSSRTPNALARELATEFRVFAEAVVVRTVNQYQICPKDFDHWEPSKSSLPAPVRHCLAQEYQKKMTESFKLYGSDEKISYLEAMHFQARQIQAILLGEIKEFWPISVK